MFQLMPNSIMFQVRFKLFQYCCKHNECVLDLQAELAELEGENGEGTSDDTHENDIPQEIQVTHITFLTKFICSFKSVF